MEAHRQGRPADWTASWLRKIVDPSGELGLLLPVRIGEVEPPGLLRTRIYVDLVGRDAQSARAALLAAALRLRGKPTQAPVFPGDQRAAGSATGVPRFPGELPAIWNVPFHPNPFFTGRDLLSAELQTRLTTTDAIVRRVVRGAGVESRTIVGLNSAPAPWLNRVGEVLLLGLPLLTVRSRVKR